MVFFCKGVIETVKKFGWPPDIVHCHGWMTSLIPLYLRSVYQNEPIFKDAQILYSVYNEELENQASEGFVAKASINNLESGLLDQYLNGEGLALHTGAITYADALIEGSENLKESLLKDMKDSGKPVLEFAGEEFQPAYMEFYKSLLEE